MRYCSWQRRRSSSQSGQAGLTLPMGIEHAVAVRPALLGQAAVDRVELLVEHGLEAAGPGLRDAVLAQLGDQRLGPGVLQLAERPLKQVDVAVDDVRSRGSRARRWFGTSADGIRQRGGERQRGGNQRRLHKTPPIDRSRIVTVVGHVSAILLELIEAEFHRPCHNRLNVRQCHERGRDTPFPASVRKHRPQFSSFRMCSGCIGFRREDSQ